jgi:hypothetical protein
VDSPLLVGEPAHNDDASEEGTMTQYNENDTNEDVRRVSGAIASRLEGLGIWLSGSERAEELARLQEAVERFELAVESRGGDLMVDEGPPGESTKPDDPHFALPRRNADESVDRFLDRLAIATDEVRRHQGKA